MLSVLRFSQRRTTGRLIKAYRTTAHSVNTVLAGIPPLELTAQMHLEVYEKIAEIKETKRCQQVCIRTVERIKNAARKNLHKKWKIWLPRREGGIVDAISPQLERWVNARLGLTYHATQVLTGHSCFLVGTCVA
ncbi:PREDICTED: uncharacterized protein LOC108769770 [Trachymyrmex cornetzi]|uniref:uncharacterized protein LOC108769770 n=1 Tax=Trachymyrmex cornetzi TaxID=471704 RepID=UPI00084F1725|nr:PREDICTED: uncharacterized protein LOC108769770 [Trachymyrmex cornetzi]